MSCSRLDRPLKPLLCAAAVYSLMLPDASRGSERDDVAARIAAVQKIPVPLPEKTPFDSSRKAREIYLEEYCAGYRAVLAAVFVDCHIGVLGPYFEAFQQGWTDGKNAALTAHPEKTADLLGIPWDQYKAMIGESKPNSPQSSSR